MSNLVTQVKTWQFFHHSGTQEKLTNYNIVVLAGELFDAADGKIHLMILAAFDIWWVVGDSLRAKELLKYAKAWQTDESNFKHIKDEILYYALCSGISEEELQGFIKLYYTSGRIMKPVKIFEPAVPLMFIYPPKNFKL